MQSDPQNEANDALKAELADAHKEIKRLQDELDILHGITLHPIAQQILVCLHKNGQRGLTSSSISNQIQADQTTTDYHLEALSKGKYIRGEATLGRPSAYFLDQNGREYLIVYKLIP